MFIAYLSIIAICFHLLIIPAFGVYGLATDSDNIGIISGRVYHIKAYNGKYLDVANAGTANGTNVQIYTFNVDAACQEWVITQDGTDGGDRLYKIKDVNSGKLLSIEASSSANAANAWIWEDDGTNGQIFKIKRNSDGTFTFYTQCSGYAKALSYDSAMNAQQTDSTADSSTHFSISYAGLDRYKNDKGVCDGYNLLFNAYYDTVPYYDSSDSNTYVHMSLFKNLNYLPEIYFTYLGQGYYSMRSIVNSTTYYLTAPASTSSGQKITWSATFSDTNNNQLWQVSYSSSGKTYTIISKNMVLAGKDYGLSATSSYLVQNNIYATPAQWKLCYNETYQGDNLLVGIIDSQHSDNHSSWIGSAASALYSTGSDSVTIYYNANIVPDNGLLENTQKDILMEDMENKKIIEFYAHGFLDNSGSYIRISDTAESPVYLDTNDIKKLDLSDTEFIVFGSCSTAANYATNGAENMLTASVTNAGALMAVGFTDKIQCNNLQTFMQTITQNYAQRLASYTDYSSKTPAEQSNIRSVCYRQAVEQAATASGLSNECVIFTNSNYITFS